MRAGIGGALQLRSHSTTRKRTLSFGGSLAAYKVPTPAAATPLPCAQQSSRRQWQSWTFAPAPERFGEHRAPPRSPGGLEGPQRFHSLP